VKTIASQVFFVSGVCCATEEAVVRKTLDGMLGREGYRFNAATGELTVSAVAEDGRVARELRAAGFGVRDRRSLQHEPPFLERHADGLWTAAAAVLAAVGMLVGMSATAGTPSRLLLGAAILTGGWRIVRKALGALRARTLDMNVLMTIAVVGALAIDKWSEGAAVVVLFSAALMLESYSVSRTRRAIRSLMTISPSQALVLRDGTSLVLPAAEIVPGEMLLIRPGERVALDGVVVSGGSSVDQSPITGESTPVHKRPGDTVYAGSINARGALQVRVTARHEETMLARIVHLVEEAEQQRAPVQATVERFARIYTPAVLALGVLVALLPPLVAGGLFIDWFYRALVLLVIACPCALVISTPVTIVSALANAARHGVLIKGGKHLETLGTVRSVAYDKTGTLTEGNARVTDVFPLNGTTRLEVLRIAAALELHSEHPLAEAVIAEAVRSGALTAGVRVEHFEALPGRGIRGTIDGVEYYVGNEELARTAGADGEAIDGRLRELSAEGKTAVILMRSGEPVAILAVQDGLREHARHAIRRLESRGVKHHTMLTGDQEGAAERIAAALGIEQVQAGLLPEQKVAAIGELRRRHGVVAMVGDGINDAPALAAASVGIAMGVGGTDAALETADVVLMSDDLGKLPFLFGLGRRTIRIIRQNIALALGLKIVFLLLSIAGYATLWMAVLADDGAALLVIANGLRALSFKDPS
jgi:Zn2+/Cd2+-exporting ATPase